MKKHLLQMTVFLLTLEFSFAQTANLLKDIRPGNKGSNPDDMIQFSQGRNLFFAWQSDNSLGLWLTNGDSAQTQIVSSFAGAQEGQYQQLTKVSDGLAVFTSSYYTEDQLWKATATGAYLLQSFNRGVTGTSPPEIGPVINGMVFFRVLIGNTDLNDIWQLWVTNGTTGATILLADSIDYRLNARTVFDFSTVLDNNLIFYAYNAANASYQIWRSDGTKKGTYILKDFGKNIQVITTKMTVINNSVIFGGGDAEHGSEPWKTDGTPKGTKLLKDIEPGIASSNPSYFTVLNRKVYFLAQNSFGTKFWWKTNGTSKGTIQVDMPSTLENVYSVMGVTGGKIFFVGLDDGLGERPFTTDGTVQGTQVITDQYPGIGIGAISPSDFIVVKGIAYFVAAIETYYPSWSLFRSDGTFPGTTEILHNPRETDDNTIYDLTDAGGTLYFINNQKNIDGGESLYSYNDNTGLQQYDFIPNQSDKAEILLGNKKYVFLSLDGTGVGQEPYVLNTGNVNPKVDIAFEASGNALLIYPNPSAGQFNIVFSLEDISISSAVIEIRNISGQIVYSKNEIISNGELKTHIQLNESLSGGMYYVSVHAGNRIFNKKIVLE